MLRPRAVGTGHLGSSSEEAEGLQVSSTAEGRGGRGGGRLSQQVPVLLLGTVGQRRDACLSYILWF